MHARNPVSMNWSGHITDKALSWRKSVERSQISFDHAHVTASTLLRLPIPYIGQDGPSNFLNATIRRSTTVMRIRTHPLSLATYGPAPVYGA